MKKILRSITSILAGLIATAVLSIGTDLVLQEVGFFPSLQDPLLFTPALLLIALIYRSLFTIVGGYITAMLAPSKPVRHTIILGIIGFLLATLGSAANWDKTTPSTTWYPILLIVLAIPCTWLGGRLKMNALQRNATA